MKTFKITTSSICITEYLVEAPDQETAEELYNESTESREVDFQDERVIKVENLGVTR